MRFYRYTRDKTYGTYDLGWYQLYLCELKDTKGKLHPGLSVLFTNSIIEVPFPLSKEQATNLSLMFKNLSELRLPVRHTLRCGWANYFCNLRFSFKEFKDNSIKGWIRAGFTIGFNATPSFLTVSTAKRISNKIDEIYKLA